MRVLSERTEMAALLAALLILPAGAGAAKEGAPPDERARFEQHVRYLTAEGGEWIADNAGYREAGEHEPAFYRMVYRPLLGDRGFTARLTSWDGVADTAVHWDFWTVWHPEEGRARVEQVGADGTLGVGWVDHPTAGPVRAEQDFASSEGATFRVRHEEESSGWAERRSRSATWGGEAWRPGRSYVWRRPACQPVATERFALYSDPWVNLHHFLYQWARAGVEPGPGDTRHPVAVAERGELARLDAAEREAWERAVGHYGEHFVARSLTFDRELVGLKSRLLEVGCGGPEALAALPEPAGEMLAAAMPVYRRHWWPRHDAVNRAWIADLAARLREIEAATTARLAAAYGGSWPEGPMRVDASVYANHAGAYTTDRPDHVMLVCTEPLHQDWGAVEALLHEAGHSLALEQGVHASLESAFAAAGAGEPPRGLWHVLLFVTPHELLRQRLAEQGADLGPSYAHRAGIYDRNEVWDGYREALEAEWVPYLRGEREREEALAALTRAVAP
jgi:hypothetical protein